MLSLWQGTQATINRAMIVTAAQLGLLFMKGCPPRPGGGVRQTRTFSFMKSFPAEGRLGFLVGGLISQLHAQRRWGPKLVGKWLGNVARPRQGVCCDGHRLPGVCKEAWPRCRSTTRQRRFSSPTRPSGTTRSPTPSLPSSPAGPRPPKKGLPNFQGGIWFECNMGDTGVETVKLPFRYPTLSAYGV